MRKYKKSFNAHFVKSDRNSENDWDVRLIDQADNLEELRKRGSLVT